MRPSASSAGARIATFWAMGGGLLALFLVVQGETEFDEVDFAPLMTVMGSSHDHYQTGASSPRLLRSNGDFEVNRIAIDDTGKEIGKGKGSFHIGGVDGKVIPGDKLGVFDPPALEGNLKDKKGQNGDQGGKRDQDGQQGGDNVDEEQIGGGGGSIKPGGEVDKELKGGSKTGGGGGIVKDGTQDGGGRFGDSDKGGSEGTGRVPSGGRLPEESKKEVGVRTERDGERGGGIGGGDKRELGNTIVIPGTGGNIVLTEGGVLAGENLPTEGKNILNNLLPEIGKKPEGCIVFGDVKPGNLTCYSCKVDFRKTGYDKDNPCLGRHGNKVDKKYLVRCGSEDIFCRVERNEVNGIMIQLTRECTDLCYYGCRPKGFGINNEACSKCCNSDGCNDMYPESSAPNLPSMTRSVVLLPLTLLLSSGRHL